MCPRDWADLRMLYFYVPCSIHCPGNAARLICRTLKSKNPMGHDLIMFLVQTISSTRLAPNMWQRSICTWIEKKWFVREDGIFIKESRDYARNKHTITKQR